MVSGYMISDQDRHTILTTEEAAAFLKMTPRMLSERRRAGKISCFKDGDAILYSVAHLKAYLMSVEWGGGRKPRRNIKSANPDVDAGPGKRPKSDQRDGQQKPKPPQKAADGSAEPRPRRKRRPRPHSWHRLMGWTGEEVS